MKGIQNAISAVVYFATTTFHSVQSVAAKRAIGRSVMTIVAQNVPMPLTRTTTRCDGIFLCAPQQGPHFDKMYTADKNFSVARIE